MTCSVAGCGEKARSRGMCNKHYQQWYYRLLEPLPTALERFWVKVDRTGDVIEIPLRRGGVALIDAADLPLVEPYTWGLHVGATVKYAKTEHWVDGTRSYIYMHRIILGAPRGVEVDHINRDGLDNRRSNLRIATSGQNKANQRPRRNGTSRFRGVSKSRGRWEARCNVDGRCHRLGSYDEEETAARAYDAFALAAWGEFAYQNLPAKEMSA